jgi:hypothetical protein
MTPQAKEEKDRLRLEIVEMDLQCVTITFRDGNTTDSNLLQMITSHDVLVGDGEQGQQEHEQNHYDELLLRQSRRASTSSHHHHHHHPHHLLLGHGENLYENLTIESTGASLSIATASDPTNKNCSGQFIYFIAYYSTLTSSSNSSSLLGKTHKTEPNLNLPPVSPYYSSYHKSKHKAIHTLPPPPPQRIIPRQRKNPPFILYQLIRMRYHFTHIQIQLHLPLLWLRRKIEIEIHHHSARSLSR